MAIRSYASRTNRRQRSSQRSALARSGAAAVEMAAVLPLFILLVFGIIEFGRALMVHQMLVNSAREGARYAVTPNSTDAVLASKITNYMSSAGITGYTTTVKVNGTVGTLNSDASSDDEITITVSVPYANVTLGFAYLIGSGRTFSASVVMRKE